MKLDKWILLVFCLVIVQTSVFAWGGDNNWLRMKPIDIDNTENPNNLYNYQLNVNVTYDSDMQSDFEDLRFVDSDNVTELDYWIENKSNNEWAYVWVKVPLITSSSNKQIYMYYNNPVATSVSNGNNTFELFDDFAGWNATKWNSYKYGECYSWIDSGYLRVDCGIPTPPFLDRYVKVNSTQSFTTQHALVVYGIVNNVSTADHTHTEFGFSNPQEAAISPWTLNAVGLNSYSANRTVTAKDGTSIFNNTIMQFSSLHRYEFKWNLTVAETWYDYAFHNRSFTNIPSTSLPVGLRSATETLGGTPPATPFGQKIDYLFVRNLTSPEPTYSEGSEIIFGTFTIDSVKNELNEDSITFNLTLSNSTNSDSHYDITTYSFSYLNLNVTGSVTVTLSSDGYVQRKYYENIYGNIIINRTYYMIPSGDGLVVRFHIINQGNSPVTNATIKAYHGTYGVVEETTSDGSGVGTMFLYPYTTYMIEAVHPSYNSANYSIQPTQQDYTIVLSGGGQQPATEQLTNISYSIKPQTGINDSSTYFEFKIHSFDSKLEWYFFNVTYNGTELYSDNDTTASGGILSTTENLAGYNRNFTIVTYASYRKQNITNEFWINTSYYITTNATGTGLVDIGTVTNLLISELNLASEGVNNGKFFVGIGVIFLSMVAGAFVSQTGSGFLTLMVLGVGMILGLLTFFATGGGTVIAIVFGTLVLAFVSYIFLKGGI